MALRAFASPLDTFWEEKNQKLLALPVFLSEHGTIFDDELCFKYQGGGVTKLDFSLFDLPHFQLDHKPRLHIDGSQSQLSSKEYAKLFFLAALPKRHGQGISSIYQMVVHVIAFLHLNESSVLTGNLLSQFWYSFLSQSVNEKGFYNRVSAPAYRGTIKPISLPKTRNILQTWGVEGVIAKDLMPKKNEKVLDEVCRSSLGLTLNEYKQGGSFNFLGLELGQYYVDYLRQVYQQDYLYHVVCKNTWKQIVQQYGVSKLESSEGCRLRNVMLSAMTKFERDRNQKHTQGIIHDEIFRSTQDCAYEHYQLHFEKAMSLNDKCIEKIVENFGLEMRFDAVEVIRILMLQKFHQLDGHKGPKDVWENYQASLDKTFLDSSKLIDITVEDVYSKMQAIVLGSQLEKEAFIKDFQNWGELLLNQGNQRNYKSWKAELDKITHTMTNLVVAWLGYRGSEFGFPLSAIKTEPNYDILDNSHIPFRFHLKWLVPKTNKMVKIDREITSQCFQIAAQLNELFDITDDSPCLYKIANNAHEESKHWSESYIALRVTVNWENFLTDYPPFNDALRLEQLSEHNIDDLSVEDNVEFEHLSLLYDIQSVRFKHLVATAKKLREDWRVLSVIMRNSVKAQKRFKQSLISFMNTGEVPDEHHKEVIEAYLSEETKKVLRSGAIVLDQKAMLDIANELKQGRPYLSPHAFRHIWAESVLTRYKGNVGAVIRHQFCHLDDSFFMAYLREKEAKIVLDGAKQRYVNSIVEMIMSAPDKVGSEYLGGFSRYVKKATDRTQALTENELRTLRDKINGRIINIQPSHFAICIPREGGEQRAKCAQFGSMNPHNAKPEFCLVCTNAYITSGHVKGIWTTIQPMVKECLNENVMGFMVGGHLPTLRSGYKRIKELRESFENKEPVDKILMAIIKAINAVEFKLKQEELTNVE
ncbi:hypothetical protein L1D55_25735 [Vibrio sp. Isolate22]|uniref:hypothetical protein n=1 Tax=Vibrio sp. Isolate22 TaxID=2908532 RepID=UPI001EFDC086|nr:hypothetical protein [Vibrio sp. Isolate22]MCG9695064.1 hypothetical protein [Vibrio sp. Isolate22]